MKTEFKSRKHLGSGNYEWTYSCACTDTDSHEITFVASGNRSQADQLADIACEEKCQTNISDSTNVIVQTLDSDLHYKTFTGYLDQSDEEAHEFILCTGHPIRIAKSVIKDIQFLGTCENDGKILVIALVQFDVTRAEGVAVYQLCDTIDEIVNNSSEQTKHETQTQRSSQSLIENSIRVSPYCSGIACRSNNYAFYNAPSDILDWASAGSDGVNVINIRQLGSRRLRIHHSALGGTRCGRNYSGKAFIDVVLAD